MKGRRLRPRNPRSRTQRSSSATAALPRSTSAPANGIKRSGRRAEGLLRRLGLVEHPQVTEHRVGEVVDRVAHDFRDGEDRRPHVDDGGWHATLLAWPERWEKWAGCPGRARSTSTGVKPRVIPTLRAGRSRFTLLPHAP